MIDGRGLTLRPVESAKSEIPAQATRRRLLTGISIFPALLAMSYVMGETTETATPLAWAWRTVAVAGGTVLLLQAGLRLAGFGRAAGGVALVIWLWVLGDETLLPTAAVGVGIALAAYWALRIHRGRGLAGSMSSAAINLVNLIAIFTFVQASIAAGQSEFAMSARLPELGESSESPNIYVVLLDGYPRADTLDDLFGYDNTAFVSQLEDRGFEVAERSRSNYNQTVLTIASMLGMRHIVDNPVLDASATVAQQKRQLSRAIGEARALAELRQRGYRIETIGSPFVTYAPSTSDTWIDTGQLTEAEINIVVQAARSGPLGEFLREPLAKQHRNRVLESMAALRLTAAEDYGRPRFVFAHIMSPHSPFLFYRDGSGRELPACFPTGCGFWDGWPEQIGYDRPSFSDALGQQVEFLNSLVIESVDAILEAEDVPPVIILMADHGTRYSGDDQEEMMRILFAAHIPQAPGLFPEDVSPIIVFPRLLEVLFGIDAGEPESAEYQLPMGVPVGPLEVEPYP